MQTFVWRTTSGEVKTLSVKSTEHPELEDVVHGTASCVRWGERPAIEIQQAVEKAKMLALNGQPS